MALKTEKIPHTILIKGDFLKKIMSVKNLNLN